MIPLVTRKVDIGIILRCDMDIKLWHGDCLELMKNIPDKSVDMILCDLPYGTTACKWDSIIPFDALWELYNRIKMMQLLYCLGVNHFQPF